MLHKSILAAIIVAFSVQANAQTNEAVNCYARWSSGPPHDQKFFPIAVWLQPPQKAKQYRAAGFNTYVGLWDGPTDEQLAILKQAGMKVICRLNAVGLKHLDDSVIIGWNHGDEPDNAQALGQGHYGPPIPPEKIVKEYDQMRAMDSTRPILLNLGQGVAWDDWTGRGARTHHLEDYPKYLQGCDIASFDIYPAAASAPEVAGKLFLVAKGVQRLVNWSGTNRIVWNCIECTHIENPAAMATPEEVRAEVWMSLIHGSRGLIYFAHEWKPRFNASALLANPEMLGAVTAINHQITGLAPVLNSPTIESGASVVSANSVAPIAIMEKKHGGAIYLFAVGMRRADTAATFTIENMPGEHSVEVIGEDRTLTAKNGRFEDQMAPWGVRLYRLDSR